MSLNFLKVALPLMALVVTQTSTGALAHHISGHNGPDVPPNSQVGAINQYNQTNFNINRTQPWMNGPLQAHDIDFRQIQDDMQVLSTQGQILPMTEENFEAIPPLQSP